MRLGHVGAIIFSGFTWLLIGVFLLYKGVFYLAAFTTMPSVMEGSVNSPLLNLIAGSAGGVENGVLILVSLGLAIGFMKGRFVLSKTVARVVKKIILTPSPLKLSAIYSKGYLLLIGSMMLLGISLKFLPVPVDCRGLVDVAIGSALINGALLYFKHAAALKQQKITNKK